MTSSISSGSDFHQAALKPTDNTILLSSTMEQSVVPSQGQIIHQVGGKHQVLPVVYIQAPKMSSKPSTNTGSNVILNAMPQIQIQNLTPVNTKSVTLTNQSVLIGKQPIMLQKQQVMPKNGVTYLTMLKPVNKPDDRIPVSNIQSKHMLVPNTNSAQKFVIAPMPKVTGNRLPITATTNTVQSKFSFMPITMNKQHKVINFKIADGQLQQENSAITVMCDTPEARDKNLLCNEVIDDSPEKGDDKTYQISIVEDSNSRTDAGYTISINDDERKFETPKFSKHGVSILKKTYSFLEKKEKATSQSNFSSIAAVSDADTKEVKITAEDPPQRKNERRRKSTICLRKDYDEVVQADFALAASKVPKLEVVDLEEVKEEPKIDLDLSVDDNDVAKLLTWEDGIGTLPGSDLKFQINEFGFLEYLTKDEYRKMYYKKQLRVKEEKKKSEQQEEMRCLVCGCYGMSSDFISPKYCSYDCQNADEKDNTTKLKKKRKQQLQRKNGDTKNETSDEENTSNENSSDKFSYPWTCQKKGFSWVKYLDHIKAKSAPVKLFKDPFPYNRNGFRPGMKLEGIDPMHPSYFCVLTVAEVLGYRLRLHFDGYPDNYDFWVNADSMDIFQAGFCEKYGHTLHPPPGYEKDFNWNFYLKYTRSPAAPKHLFANRPENAIFPNGFRTGMKLEAVDRKNTALVCVATIRDMMDNRILVHFDSWDDIYDYWADPTSPYIHPVAWCDQNGHNLTPPNGKNQHNYPNPESFTWEKYLKETKSVAAPVRAFKQRQTCGFKKGMRLECVDRRVPQLIRVATVDEVRDHQLRISFDGWPDRYSYFVDDDSTEIHPVGWCQKTGHPIEPPLTPDDVYDFLECATVGCRGQGHIKGPIFSTHSTQKNCPYAEENIDLEKILPDRLRTPDRQVENVVPVSREPRDKILKAKVGRPSKPPKDTVKMEWEEEEDENLDESQDKKDIIKIEMPSPEILKSVPIAAADVLEEEVNVDELRMREKHTRYLHNIVKCQSDPRDWTYEDVVDFVTSVPCCRYASSVFVKNKIDGTSLLMLSQQDLVEILNFKLGPAITLYNCILILRKTVINCT